MARRARACVVAAAAAVALVLAACGEPARQEDDGAASAGFPAVTFRLWDEAAASAYRESFDAFSAIRPEIHVDVQVVPEESYADRAASDLADGTMADIFWTTSDAVAAHAHAGDIAALDETLEDHEEWEPAVTELYTRDERLWAVPQVWDSTVLFYNTELVGRAGVDPAALTWDPAMAGDGAPLTQSAPAPEPSPGDGPTPAEEPTPANGPTPAEGPSAGEGPSPGDPPADASYGQEGGAAAPASGDTLRQAVRELTRDSSDRAATEEEFDAGAVVEHGYNTDLTAPAVWLPFLVQLGGTPGDGLVLAGPEGHATFAYLAELTVAPPRQAPGADRQLFTGGRLALFQSTSADLRHVEEHADIDWGLVTVPAGPQGPVSVVDGIAAAANAASDNPDATSEVLRWIASSDGQSALAGHGIGVPAATGAQDLFLQMWSDRGVDAAAALGTEEVVTVASGPTAQEVLEAVRPVLAELLHGGLDVAEGLATAQQAADRTLGSR